MNWPAWPSSKETDMTMMKVVVELPTGDWGVVDSEHPLRIHLITDPDKFAEVLNGGDPEEASVHTEELVPKVAIQKQDGGVEVPRQ